MLTRRALFTNLPALCGALVMPAKEAATKIPTVAHRITLCIDTSKIAKGVMSHLPEVLRIKGR